ncbi:hypothetical protein RHSIM_Rhsim06G0015000 [Rhododendron simsii]|uniref:Peptidase S8/S53 domain-containing protein n=1 Tax=Rhododendron simsii TaxID=118357 RepID=A0A834GW01_RHOSS|nr:hypothetical protein RHSIM_Rhsim06G0015000 [Rhododendron simsii]
MPDLPAKWKGECESGPDFKPTLCNKKLIGARRFSRGYHMASGSDPKVKQEIDSPRDYDGHGTHKSSTAAGANVANASGTAINARLATYKVCWKTGCFGSDMLAGMDRAILDGVDVLSLFRWRFRSVL